MSEPDCDCRNYIDCNGHAVCRVDLSYVADCPTCLRYTDSYGSREFDLLPLIQAGETDTSIELINDTRRIRYYPEIYTRTHGKQGHYCDICIPDIEALMKLNEIGDVQHDAPAEGDILVFDPETQTWRFYNLYNKFEELDDRFKKVESRIDNVEQSIKSLQTQQNNLNFQVRQLFEADTKIENLIKKLEAKITAIESAIYNWSSDKTTKIPRGNINVTSGGYNSDNGIFTRAKDQNNDLNFE